MKISKVIVPSAWLRDCSWDCDDLWDAIVSHSKESEFDEYIEEYFEGQTPSETELNDCCRFNEDEIKRALGILEEDC